MTKSFSRISSYISNDNSTSFLIWKEEDLFPVSQNPVRIDFMGIFIPTSGKMIDEINLQTVTLDKKHILVFTHNHIARIINRSEDSKCVGILFSRSYWEQVLLKSHSSNAYSRLFPYLEVTDEQHEHLLAYYKLIRSNVEQKGDNEIIRHLITGMFIELGNIYKQQMLRLSSANGSQHILMNKFLELIYDNYMQHRDVAFYADKLSLSSRYFTTVIRKVCGESALKWIEKYVALEAKLLLRDSNMTVKEIASQLNFEDTSFFCRYFKRATGFSPEEYRKR